MSSKHTEERRDAGNAEHQGAAHAHGGAGRRNAAHSHAHADRHGGHSHAKKGAHHPHPHDDGGHAHGDHGDHQHGKGLWAKIKHAVVPHSHDAQAVIQQSSEEARGEGIRTAWIGLAGMMVTAFLQVFIVAISGSMALLADTAHNFGHAVTTIPLVIAFKLGARQPNARFPYGYRRAEDIVGIFISFIIFLSAAYIVYESVQALLNPRELSNLGWVFAAGVVGFVGNELVAIYRIRSGRRIGSAALIAEGQHARADGFTSLAVVAGVALAWMGFPQADPIIGIVIGFIIFGIMLSSLKSILHRLMDGVDPDVIERVSRAATSAPGVGRLLSARARWSGHRLLVDVSIEVEPGLRSDAGHAISEAVRQAVRQQVPHVEDTHVQIIAQRAAEPHVAPPDSVSA